MKAQLVFIVLIVLTFAATLRGDDSRVPHWAARGLGPLPSQGVSCLQRSADGKWLVVGTIAAAGDPNVLVVDATTGRLTAQHLVGQRWIQDVSIASDGQTGFALCTMPGGRANEGPTAFYFGAGPTNTGVTRTGETLGEDDFSWTMFHYGDHSNHLGTVLRSWSCGAVGVWKNSLQWFEFSQAEAVAKVALTLPEQSVTTGLAVAPNGDVVLGVAARRLADGTLAPNLFCFARGSATARWSRVVKVPTDVVQKMERGNYGSSTLPDGTRPEILATDHEINAPLSIAIQADAAGEIQFVATADYGGWQRWLDSPANVGRRVFNRFQPARPTISIYDRAGQAIAEFQPELFDKTGWFDLQFLSSRAPDEIQLVAYPHHWTSRGLAGQPCLPADDDARSIFLLTVSNAKRLPKSTRVQRLTFDDAVADVTVVRQAEQSDDVVVSCWNNRLYRLTISNFQNAALPSGVATTGPCRLTSGRDGQIFAASSQGIVRAFDIHLRELWQTNLERVVPRGEKPWVAKAQLQPIAKGLWNIPGGRVESDYGGQRVIEAPDGLILIEPHGGLSMESEWAALQNAGLDPRRVKYVVATHEHGDHAPGAYLWRVVTGAQYIATTEMAWMLQHHLPTGTGYGFHPPVPTDVLVQQDTQLDLAGLKIWALRLPGHTPGSMGWMFEREGKRYVATGDLVMSNGKLGFAGSVGFSPHDVLASLRKLDSLRVDFVLPGHGRIAPPAEYIGAGIELGRSSGWGKMSPEPR